jgi:hypothetical protein
MGRDPARRHAYLRHRTYTSPFVAQDQRFVVQSQSNDDIDLTLIRDIRERLDLAETEVPDLIAALCPAREERNRMTTVLQDPIFDRFDHFHFYLLEYKWDGQAKLLLDTVQSHIIELNRPSTCYSILGLDLPVRTEQVTAQFRRIYE